MSMFRLLLAAVTASACVGATHSAQALPDGLRGDFSLVDIPGYEDCVLKSIYFDPVPTEGQKNPLIIFISSWYGCNCFAYFPGMSLIAGSAGV